MLYKYRNKLRFFLKLIHLLTSKILKFLSPQPEEKISSLPQVLPSNPCNPKFLLKAILFLKFLMFIYFLRERVCMHEGERKRERVGEGQRKSGTESEASGSELSAQRLTQGWNSTTRSCLEPKLEA